MIKVLFLLSGLLIGCLLGYISILIYEFCRDYKDWKTPFTPVIVPPKSKGSRHISELLQLLLDHIILQDKDTFIGICDSLHVLYFTDAISEAEYLYTLTFINRHKPKNASQGYWWRKGVKKPRIIYLKKMINQTRV